MSLFDKKKELSREDLRRGLREASPYIPGAGGEMYSKEQRERMEKEVFPQERFGSYISSEEAKRRLKELRQEEYKAESGAEKQKLARQRRYLEDFLGIKEY